jgi:hypothetical protein
MGDSPCENCGWYVRTGTIHKPDIENGVCQVADAVTGEKRGFARKGVFRDMYRKK